MILIYPGILKDLTSVEEVIIARAHPVISIMKLRPCRISSSVCYQRIWSHVVVPLQNPGPLLEILPSSSFIVPDII